MDSSEAVVVSLDFQEAVLLNVVTGSHFTGFKVWLLEAPVSIDLRGNLQATKYCSYPQYIWNVKIR